MNSACSSRPSAARFSTPPDSRSITHTTGPRTAPRARSSRRGVEDRAARGDDVFDDAQPLAVELAALGEPAGAVGLRLLAHEPRGQPADLRHHRGERNAAELETGERVHRRRDERHAGRAMSPEQRGVRLEHVLVEVLVADDARPQRERAREMRGGVDPAGELVSRSIGRTVQSCRRQVAVDRGGAVAVYRPACGGGENTAPAMNGAWHGMTGPGGPVIPRCVRSALPLRVAAAPWEVAATPPKRSPLARGSRRWP